MGNLLHYMDIQPHKKPRANSMFFVYKMYKEYEKVRLYAGFAPLF